MDWILLFDSPQLGAQQVSCHIGEITLIGVQKGINISAYVELYDPLVFFDWVFTI